MATASDGKGDGQRPASSNIAPRNSKEVPGSSVQHNLPALHALAASPQQSEAGGGSPSRAKTKSWTSTGNTLGSSSLAEGENRGAPRAVRTLPSWVQSYEADEDDTDATDRLLPVPAGAQVAHHHHSPASLTHKTQPGRLHDSARVSTPVTINQSPREHASRWKTFVEVSAEPRGPRRDREKVDDAWLRENMPDLEAPWQPERHDDSGHSGEEGATLFSSHRKRVSLLRKFRRALVRNPMVPLVFRLTIWIFSLVALALGASIFVLSEQRGLSQRPSTLMAIIFDSVALLYGLYITYDEYSGKPLGLRSPAAKMRLILLDLFFIAFNSANLSLAYDALYDVRGNCAGTAVREGGVISSNDVDVGLKDADLCDRQKALAAVLFIALVAWLLTFTVSVFRYVIPALTPR
ncbi:MAG: hypothetical protein M1832_001915 [Thelocarpon impressellum]|nr:MAG: hypothetical protein M1832_001915 [Thelocarpon impressellum]